MIAGCEAVCLLALEGILRAAGVEYPVFYRLDAHLGGTFRPGVTGWFQAEGRSWVSINAEGMRDREHAIAKPPGTYRIAVLGDSMAEAMSVPMGRNFCAVIERRLNGCSRLGGKTPETLNFGVSGYGTAQELLMLRERVWQFQPDLILLAMFPGNDIRNNDAALNHEVFCPYYTLENGRLALHYPPAPKDGVLRRIRDELTDHSRVLQLVTQIRKNLRTHGSDRMVVKGRDPRLYGEAGVDDATFAPPRTKDWTEAWSVTEALLVAMRDEVRAHGAEFAVALIPSGIQDYPDAAVRQAYLTHPGVENLSYAHDRLAAFLRQEGIFTIPLETPLRSYAEAHHAMLHGFPNSVMGFGHLNETGHLVAGEEMAAEICREK